MVNKLTPGVHHSGKFLAIDFQCAVCWSTCHYNIADFTRVGTWLHLVKAIGKICRSYAREIGVDSV